MYCMYKCIEKRLSVTRLYDIRKDEEVEKTFSMRGGRVMEMM